MPIQVERMPGEPIVIVTYTGNVTKADVFGMYEQSAAQTTDIEGFIYRISDVREADSNFAEIFGVLKQASQHIAGATPNPRLVTMFVGKNKWVKMMQDTFMLPHFGGVQIPAFTTMEEARHYIQLHQDKNKSG